MHRTAGETVIRATFSEKMRPANVINAFKLFEKGA
jgi:hypothetical protein